VGPGCNLPWDQAHCTTEPIIDASQDQDVRWASVGTEDVWTAAVSVWTANPSPGGLIDNILSVPEPIVPEFHGPANINCGATSDNNGCAQS
jgi:hypothetical protein